MKRPFKLKTFLSVLQVCVVVLSVCSCSNSDEPESPEPRTLSMYLDGTVYSKVVLTDGEGIFEDYYELSKQVPENPVSVTLENAGTLSDALAGKTEGMDALKVSGPMNKADLRYVAEYVKQNYLISLDLSLAQFSDNTIPDRAMEITIGREYFSSNSIGEICAGLPVFHLILPKNLQKIGTAAFAGLMIMDLELPESLKHIGKSCFLGNTIGDGELVIPNGVTTIPSDAFCSYQYSAQPVRSLTRIVLPQSVTTVENNAFRSVQAKELELGNGIKEIGAYAFFNNHAIEILELPSSLKSIDSGAFADLSALTDIYSYNSTPPDAENSSPYHNGIYAFNCYNSSCVYCSNVYQRITLHVPAGRRDAYRAAPVWSQFQKISEQ